MEFVFVLAIALLVGAVGIRVGMLLAPRVERLADRATPADATADPATGPGVEPLVDPALEPHHEDPDDRTV